MAASLLFAGLFVGVPTVAQEVAAPELIHLDIKGLPVAPISCLRKDRDGALWIGTDNGLCRYDGLNVDVYRNIPGDSTSLPGDFVRDLAMDEHGMIWVSCFGGVGVFDPHCGGRSSQVRFDRRPLLNGNGRTTSIDARDLFIDPEGGIWLAGVRNGLLGYDTIARAFRPIDALRKVLPVEQPQPFTMGVTRDMDGLVWFTDDISLYRLDPTNGRIERFTTTLTVQDGRREQHLVGVLQDPQDPYSLWLGSRGAGLIHFDKRTGICENHTTVEDGHPNFSNIVWDMLPRNNGHLLVAMDRELRDFDPRSRSFSKAIGTLEFRSGKFESIGNALMQDEEERIWVGTAIAGIFSIPPRSSDYRRWTTSAQLMCTASDRSGYWSVRQYANRKLFKLGPQGEIMDSVALPFTDKDRFEPMSIVQVHDGHVLIGTTSGLFVYDPAARALSRERFEKVEGLPEPPIGVHSIVEDADGSVWFAFNGRGLLHYWPRNARTEFVVPKTGGSDTDLLRTYRWISGFGTDLLAVIFDGGGLGVLDTRTVDLAERMSYGSQGRVLANIAALIPQGDSVLFVVTNNEGIVELRYRGDSLQHAATYVDDRDRVNGYGESAADGYGNIWIATNTGLVLFHTTDHSFRHIGPVDGLGMSSVAQIVADRDSCMLAWNVMCARFNANTFARPATVDGMYVRSVQTVGVEKNAGSSSAIVLPHDSNSVTITYAPIALLHAEELRYEVLLDGHDDHWVDNGYQRSVSYVGLAPGRYTLKVRLAGRTDSNLEPSCSFIIVPAWWQTWWFKIGAALIISVFIFFLSRYILLLRYRQQIAALEREREIGAVRTRIARDIHDDIGSGLTRITMLSREMNSAKETAEAKERLAGSIASTSTELIGQLSEIVWTVDPKNDHAEGFIAHVRNLLGKQFEELSVALHTDLSVEPGMEHRDIPPDVKRNVVMILKETVSNALKHARSRTISVKLHIGADRLSMQLEDDGAGFNTSAERTHGNGLGNLRKRSEAIGGTLEVESDGKGTRYALRVPLPSPTFMRGE